MNGQDTTRISSVGETSSYLDHLPRVYRQESPPGSPAFLGRFLLAFEKVLTGLADPEEPGLEELLEGIVDPVSGNPLLSGLERYFEPGPGLPDPQRAPAPFLDWLAGWVAVTLRADLDELRQRDFIASAVSLYGLRGTRRGLEEVLRIYTRLGVSVDELDTPFQIGVHSTVGVDTLLDGGPPHFFRVLVRLPSTEPAELARHQRVVTELIDQEKPAHTYYALVWDTPIFRIGVNSTVGVDTLLGPATH